MAEFLSEDFLLYSKAAKTLYHEYAEGMPIYDYHCHLPAQPIADDICFDNITQAWLAGDHYKWRAMRTNGVAERYVTGQANDIEKFEKWAETAPYTIGNPLFHWTHLELKRYFGISGKLLNAESAKGIYDSSGEMLRSKEFSIRNLMRKMNVKLVCTTEGPLDGLEYHKRIHDDGFEVKVHTTWRPDEAMAIEDAGKLNGWIGRLREATGVDVKDFNSYIEAIRKRHDFFHENGCRLSDHGLETAYAEDYTEYEIEKIFAKILASEDVDESQQLKFKSAMMFELAKMDFEKGWAQQLHFGAIRNNNSRMMKLIGPDTGFDSMGDDKIAESLSRFLDRLDTNDQLPKTIIYNLNPKDSEMIATMLGNFYSEGVPGKMQYGSAWWFLDQKDGMEKQIRVLSNIGLLSRFVGMLTDSRSFLSYPRHEYFRRILCNCIGGDVERGELPGDMKLLGKMVKDICYNNAVNYFSMAID